MVRRILFDTDIGSDVDDALALGLVLACPDELELVAVTTVARDTELRARLAARMLALGGRDDVEVCEGEREALLRPERFGWFRHEEAMLGDGPEGQLSDEPAPERIVRAAREEGGLEIVMIGHRGHVEVEGTMGQAPGRMHLVESVADVATLEVADPERLGCVTQTTLSVDDTREMMEALAVRFPAIRLPRKDDICYATQNRQDAVKALARDVEFVLVVGAPESSNSNRLVEVAQREGAQARLVQTADDIDPAWLAGATSVGVTAGASAPELLVEQVVERLAKLAPGVPVAQQPEVDEGIVFQLPALLR